MTIEDEIIAAGESLVANVRGASELKDMVESAMSDGGEISLEDATDEVLSQGISLYEHYGCFWQLYTNAIASIEPVPLSLTIMEHDLADNQQNINSQISSLKMKKDKGLATEWLDSDNFQNFLADYELCRIALSNIAYVATGNPEFLVPTEHDSYVSSNFQQLMNRFVNSRGDVDIRYNVPEDVEIPADHFFAAAQVIKNAVKYGKLEGQDRLESSGISVTIQSTPHINIITIEDHGPGIPPEILTEMFGSFTLSGTGYGLQYVAKINEIRRGRILVSSTEPGKPTYTFNLRTSERRESTSNKSPGTVFELYLPK